MRGMSTHTAGGLYNKTFINTEFDREVDLLVAHFTSLTPNVVYTITLSSGDDVVYSGDFLHPSELECVKYLYSIQFCLSGVSDVSQPCYLSFDLHPKGNKVESVNVVESIPTKSVENKNQRIYIISSVLQ